MKLLKDVQKNQGEALLTSKVKVLNSVISKNKLLVDSVPDTIAGKKIKSEFLQQRKNLMIRLIHSEVRNKKISEWTMKSMNKIQRNQLIDA